LGKSAALFGGDWGNGSVAGSRCSNWNNAASNSNNNIGSRFCCDDTSLLLCKRYGFAGRPSKVWSADLVLLWGILYVVW